VLDTEARHPFVQFLDNDGPMARSVVFFDAQQAGRLSTKAFSKGIHRGR
jgi:hypothetical protein